MTAKIIIPVYKFKKILSDIVLFYQQYLKEAIIIIVNDDEHCSLDSFRDSNVIVFNSMIRGDLRHTYSHYAAVTDLTDIVITNEHDVFPNPESLHAMIHMYSKMKDEMKLASVSCMYHWNGRACYPSHPNWLKGKRLGKEYSGEVGEVTLVGAQGVPFGFTLWNSFALERINNQNLPKLWKLDSKFGELLDSYGYTHLRLIEYSVEHYERGMKTWKEKG